MIQANELRIGNITEYGTILAMPFEDGRIKALLEIGICEIEQLEPIKIDSKFLDQILYCKKIECRTYYGKELFEYHIRLDGFNGQYLTVSNLHGTSVYKGKGSESRLMVMAFISSIHEIQNLYFALTGTELEFKRVNENN